MIEDVNADDVGALRRIHRRRWVNAAGVAALVGVVLLLVLVGRGGDREPPVSRSASADESLPDEVLDIGALELVALDTPQADLDLVNGTATLDASQCLVMRAVIAGVGDNADGRVTAKLPGLNLEARFDDVRATIRCGSSNSISLAGTLTTSSLGLKSEITLRWPDESTWVPEVRLVASLAATVGQELRLSDLVTPVGRMIGADLRASELPLDLALNTLNVDAQWPRQGDAWFDMTVGTTVSTNRGTTLDATLLTSATRSTRTTVLWGVRLSPPSGSTATFETLLANDALSWLGGLTFPELHLGFTTPADTRVSLADLSTERSLPRLFFTGKEGSPRVNTPFDSTLRATASVDLDALGDELRGLVGYAPGARTMLQGSLGLRIGDLLTGSGSPIELTSVSAVITLPGADGSEGSLLPDTVRLGDTQIAADWRAETGALHATLSAAAAIDLPDPSKPGGTTSLNLTMTSRFDGDDDGGTAFTLEGMARGTEAAPALPNAFGLEWFDVVDAGTTIEVSRSEAGGVAAKVATFGIIDVAGVPARVDLKLASGPAGSELTLEAAIPEPLPLASVARQWGLTLPTEFEMTVGGDPAQPTRLEGHFTLGDDSAVSGGIGFHATGALVLGPSTFTADLLLTVGFEPGGTTRAFAGARLDTTTVSELAGAVSRELGAALGSTNLGAVSLPTSGVVLTSEPLQAVSTELSVDQRSFFDPLFGCRPGRPCSYTVDLAPGVHIVSDIALPTQSGSSSTVMFEDVYRAFWMEEPPSAQLNLSLTRPRAGQPLLSDGLDARIKLAIRPDPSRQADWFRNADLAVGMKVSGTGVAFDLRGQLGIRLLDTTRTTSGTCSDKTWVADARPGGGGCYDELDIAVASELDLGVTNRFTLSGAVTAQRGWRQPLGIKDLEISSAVAQFDITLDAAGPSLQMGFYISGALVTERGARDLAGSLVVGLRPVPAPPFVVPTFGGLRVSSRNGLDLGDIRSLVGLAPSVSADTATAAGAVPSASLRNAEFMVGTSDYPNLCISTGLRLSAELYVGDSPPPVSTPGETPRTCAPQPVDAPITCRQASTPCTAAVALRSDTSGVALVGSIDRWELGRVTWSNAELVVDLTQQSPRFRVSGQATVTGLGRGSIDIDLSTTRGQLAGDVELFAPAGSPNRLPPLRAAVSALVTGDSTSLLRSDRPSSAGLDLHVQLQGDMGALVRTVATDALNRFSDTALLIDALYQDLKNNEGDVLRTLRTVPRQLHESGVRVPTWVYNPTPFSLDVTVVAGWIDDFMVKNGLPRLTAGQVFSGTTLDPPILGIKRIPGIKDYISSAPGSYREFLETIVEPAVDGALRRLGLPSGWTLSQAVAQLQARVDGLDIPVIISCADFRLALDSSGSRTTLRINGTAWGKPIGVSLAWDTTKAFWDQLAGLGPTLVRQLFVEPALVECGAFS